MELVKIEEKMISLSKNYLSIQKAFITHTISNRYLDVSNPFVKYCLDIEHAYYSLSSPLRRIINNEFFYQTYSLWWKKYYSKKQFKVLRQIAIYRFMEAYHEI